MPIRTGEAAPYAPPATVLQVVNALRDRGLTTPITSDVLLRAGISDSLVPRTLRSLIGLELIEEDGKLTQAMDGLRRAPSTEFQDRLKEHVRGVYEEVFRFTDPATDDPKRIADAFRAYEPIGQRGRMVTLFIGLCEAAGIVPENAARKQATNNAGPRKAPIRPIVGKRSAVDQKSGGPAPASGTGIDNLLAAALQKLPANNTGWTQDERAKWVEFFTKTLDFLIPVREEVVADVDEDED